MPTTEELNRNWEEQLTNFNAQTWARMKAVGATAGWEDPWSSLPAGVPRAATNEFFEFVVRFRGNELIRETRTSEPAEALVTRTVFRAARMLESLGVQVIPR